MDDFEKMKQKLAAIVERKFPDRPSAGLKLCIRFASIMSFVFMTTIIFAFGQDKLPIAECVAAFVSALCCWAAIEIQYDPNTMTMLTYWRNSVIVFGVASIAVCVCAINAPEEQIPDIIIILSHTLGSMTACVLLYISARVAERSKHKKDGSKKDGPDNKT